MYILRYFISVWKPKEYLTKNRTYNYLYYKYSTIEINLELLGYHPLRLINSGKTDAISNNASTSLISFTVFGFIGFKKLALQIVTMLVLSP